MIDREIRNIKLVGSLIFGLGFGLTVITLVAAAIVLLAFSRNILSIYSPQATAQLALALVTGLSMVACGSQLSRVKPPVIKDPDGVRLNWTALVIALTLSSVASFFTLPVLANVTLVSLVLLILIRSAIIRSTR